MELKDKVLDDFTDEDLDLFGHVVGYLITSKNDAESFKYVQEAYDRLKKFIVKNSDSNKTELLLNKKFVEETLKDYISNLEGEEKLDRKVENLIGLYEDRLDNNEISEEIIRYELDLPKNGNRDTWMNLIDGIVELSSGKSSKFIDESNKVLTLYKKEK